MADELVFRQWFRRPPPGGSGWPRHHTPRRRFPPQLHVDEVTASFASTVGFVSSVPVAPFASTVLFTSSFGLPGLFVVPDGTVLFRSKFRVTGGDLASPRYRR